MLISLIPVDISGSKPSEFFNFWLEYKNFQSFVQKGWSNQVLSKVIEAKLKMEENTMSSYVATTLVSHGALTLYNWAALIPWQHRKHDIVVC
nr:hypothetical protein CFP56_40412 [Quercus suber]